MKEDIATFFLRIKKPLKHALEVIAKNNERSLTKEINYRLKESVEKEGEK